MNNEEKKVYEANIVDDNIKKVEKDKKNYQNIFIKAITVIILVSIGAVGMYYIMKNIPGTTIINKSEKEVTVNENGIADAVEKVYDSVVVIENYVNNKLYATGSGFFFEKKDNTYYIMTNYHVIENATSIKIKLTDGSTETVTYVGGDKYSDIAVLSITSNNDYQIASMGSSTDARVGDTVFAIGTPLDSDTYSWTVTRGILSGKDRMVAVSISSSSTSDYIMKVLQTDAAINSGNSGGALCNSNGEVIGITNMKLISSGVEGMGFAIPIEDAYEFATKIINGEDITRPTLGITMSEITDASYYGVSIPDNVEYGVAVLKVQSDSAADNAGIKSGDVIVSFDNVDIKSSAQLKYELYKHNIGDSVKVKVNRNGSIKELTIQLKK